MNSIPLSELGAHAPADAMVAQRQRELFEECLRVHGAALGRLTRGYEAHPDKRRDLLQDVHLALFRSLALFDGRASLRTWVFRVGHNVGSSYVLQQKRSRAGWLLDIDELEHVAQTQELELELARKQALERVWTLMERLRPVDRQVLMLYLEDLDAASISEITGLSPQNVATKIHRSKALLRRAFEEREPS